MLSEALNDLGELGSAVSVTGLPSTAPVSATRSFRAVNSTTMVSNEGIGGAACGDVASPRFVSEFIEFVAVRCDSGCP